MSHERFGAELGEQPDGLYLRIVHSLGQPLCFRLAPMKGSRLLAPDEYTVSMSAGGIVVQAGEDQLFLTFERPDALSVSGDGLGLRLDAAPVTFEYAARYTEERCLINTAAARAQFMLEVQRGELTVDAPYATKCCRYIHCDCQPDDSGRLQLTCDYFENIWSALPHEADARQSMKANQASFEAFCAGFPAVDKENKATAELALYCSLERDYSGAQFDQPPRRAHEQQLDDQSLDVGQRHQCYGTLAGRSGAGGGSAHVSL